MNLIDRLEEDDNTPMPYNISNTIADTSGISITTNLQLNDVILSDDIINAIAERVYRLIAERGLPLI